MRVGIGYDIHRLVDGRNLILGGVKLDHPKGLLGHSDADVLLHAMMDAILGSIGAPDIGKHFPDTDDRYKDISSMKLLSEVGGILRKSGYEIVNIDSVVIAENPMLAPHIDIMRNNISGVLNIPFESINIKATTNEGLGDTGRGEAIAAHAVVLVRNADTAGESPQEK